jgi:hypothetical protein
VVCFIESILSCVEQMGIAADQNLRILPAEPPIPVAAVPEPEIYAMFMTGFGLMGFIARRRKNSQV